MSNKLKKIVILAMVLSMAFGVTAFAAEPAEVKPAALMTQTAPVKENKPYSKQYYDAVADHTIVISGTAYVTGQVEYNEGVDGWFTSVDISAPSASIVTYSGKFIIESKELSTESVTPAAGGINVKNNVATKTFTVKTDSNVLSCVATCDGYGDVAFSATLK